MSPKGDDNDEDVIIPDDIAFPLVISSHLLLVTATVALVYAILYEWDLAYGVFATDFVLYLTSVVHWRRPRFSSIARRLDYVAVFAALGFGSYVATTLNLTFILIWFIGLFIVGCIFITNEYLYYVQVMKHVDGSSSHTSSSSSNSTTAANHLLDGAFDIETDQPNPLFRQAAVVAASDDGDQCCGTWSCCEPTRSGTPAREAVYVRATWVHLLCVHVLTNALALTLIVGGVDHRSTVS